MDAAALEALSRLSGPAFLVATILAGAKGYWVWGWVHREKVTDLERQLKHSQDTTEYFRAIAMQTLDVAEKHAASERSSPWKH